MRNNRVKFDHFKNLSATKNKFKNFDHIRHIRTYKFIAEIPAFLCPFVFMYISLVNITTNYPNYRYGKKKPATRRFQIVHPLQNP